MQEINIDRSARCMAVIFSNNEAGRNVAAHLISNMFDLDRGIAYEKFIDAKCHLIRHQQADGGLKDFEDGKFAEE